MMAPRYGIDQRSTRSSAGEGRPGPRRARTAVWTAALGVGLLLSGNGTTQVTLPLPAPGKRGRSWLGSGALPLRNRFLTNRLAAREEFLRRRLETRPTNALLRLRLALVVHARGRTNEALADLANLAKDGPVAAGYLALLSERDGVAPSLLSTRTTAALRLLTNRLAAATNDAPALRLLTARVHRVARDYAAALACLEQGRSTTNRLAYARLAGEIITEWAATTADLEQRWRILRRGFDAGWGHPGMRRETILLSREAGLAGEAARRFVDERLHTPRTAAAWFGSLGSEALERGNVAEARRYFLKAVNLAPNRPPLLNNTAALLALSGERADLDQALELIERALARAPHQAEYLDTRGQIRLRLGRLYEAVADFQAALRGRLANPAATHRALAEALRRLGREEEAARHETAAAALAAVRPLPDWLEAVIGWDEPTAP